MKDKTGQIVILCVLILNFSLVMFLIHENNIKSEQISRLQITTSSLENWSHDHIKNFHLQTITLEVTEFPYTISKMIAYNDEITYNCEMNINVYNFYNRFCYGNLNDCIYVYNDSEFSRMDNRTDTKCVITYEVYKWNTYY